VTSIARVPPTPAAPPTRSERLQAGAARFFLGLPAPVQRLLAGGRATRRDGLVLEADMQLLLALMDRTGAPAIDRLSPTEARRHMALNARMLALSAEPLARVEQLTLRGPAGPIPARLYAATHAPDPRPLLVYYHGGGWVVGGLDTHEVVCRFLAREARVQVLSVDYRLAPEHRFPSAVEDALAAFRIATQEAAALGADPARIAVSGDSAGGNLAAVVSQLAAQGGTDTPPAFQLLFYPVTDLSKKHASYRTFADGFFLTERTMDWYRKHYLAHEDEAFDPRASPLLSKDLTALPPAHIVTAGFDPLRDEGEAYAARLREAGVPVTLRRHPGQIHGFCNVSAVARSARAALVEAAAALRAGLGVD
jgi:acetyl esterase